MFLTEETVIEIPKETKPDIPNPNGKIYTKKAYDIAIRKAKEQLVYIPLIKEETCGECISGVTIGLDLSKLSNPTSGCFLLGSVSEMYDDYITAVIPNNLVKEVNKMIEEGYTAHMNYIADYGNSNICNKIDRILYFSLYKSIRIQRERKDDMNNEK